MITILTLEHNQVRVMKTSIPNKAINFRTRVEPLAGLSGRQKIVMTMTAKVKKQ